MVLQFLRKTTLGLLLPLASSCTICDFVTKHGVCAVLGEINTPSEKDVTRVTSETLDELSISYPNLNPSGVDGTTVQFHDDGYFTLFGGTRVNSFFDYGRVINVANVAEDSGTTVLGAFRHELAHIGMLVLRIPTEEHHREMCRTGFEPVWCLYD